MKAILSKRHPAGYVSLLVVLSTGTLLALLMVMAYKRASDAHSVQAKAQLRIDYAEKEESILRSILTITPNRAIRAMQNGSAVTEVSDQLSWNKIFSDALELANARNSVSSAMQTSINVTGLQDANTGDSALENPAAIFKSVLPAVLPAVPPATAFVSAGLNRNFDVGYPASLHCNDAPTSANDANFPIISDKKYDPLAPANEGPQFDSHSKFGLVRYPKINFGYAKPGELFVAKRNWWAFSMDVAANDRIVTKVATTPRNFVLSIYEIPSQLAISAASFMSLGKYESGDTWQTDNVKIAGGMFVGKAEVSAGGTTRYDSLSSRRGMTIEQGASIGGENFAGNTFSGDPFKQGAREVYQVNPDKILPVSLASESSRATFIPISRGREMDGNQPIYPFFDRFANADESNVLSSTSWNDYSSGAMQCAMRLTVTKVVSKINQKPTMLEFEYYPPVGGRALAMKVPQDSTVLQVLPPGFKQVVASEGGSYDFGNQAMDIAYGADSTDPTKGYVFARGISGNVRFGNDNGLWQDPNYGTLKRGFARPRAPFELKVIATSGDPTADKKSCIAVYPERFPAFLTAIGAAGTARNHSLVVNVNYTNSGGVPVAQIPDRPQIDPCRDIDYGVVLQECANLTGFTKGFSLVTNLRLYFGDNFNVVPTTPGGSFMPPCSLFAPEKRYGLDINPVNISVSGQIGSLANGHKEKNTDVVKMVRPLESKNMLGDAIASNRIEVNLSPLLNPAELPPITMMNWLVLIEERRTELDVTP